MLSGGGGPGCAKQHNPRVVACKRMIPKARKPRHKLAISRTCSVLNSLVYGRAVFCDFLPRTAVRHDELVSDRTVDQIYELTDRLEERLNDSAYLRERLTKAHHANQWPDLEGAVARVARRRRSSDIR